MYEDIMPKPRPFPAACRKRRRILAAEGAVGEGEAVQNSLKTKKGKRKKQQKEV